MDVFLKKSPFLGVLKKHVTLVVDPQIGHIIDPPRSWPITFRLLFTVARMVVKEMSSWATRLGYVS